MIRVFNLYFPTRKLVLLGGEAAIISASFLLALLLRFGPDASFFLSYGHGLLKIGIVTGLTLLCAHYVDLYDLKQRRTLHDTIVQLFLLLGNVACLLGVLSLVFPELLVGNYVVPIGLCILPVTWISWRSAYDRLLRLSALRENAYLIGSGKRASRIAEALRSRPELGVDLVGWAGESGASSLTREALGNILMDLAHQKRVNRVIVAMVDRRTTMPIHELLELRLQGMRIEDGSELLEKISGQIEVDELHPSWLIFGEGFRLTFAYHIVRRFLSILVSLTLLLLVLPLIPLIVLLIKVTSPGPALYKQPRVGRNGKVFLCYKFRTMRANAEADSGPTWAGESDPRITPVGRFLRSSRLDEIPQLWNVFRGDMEFVGPRPERPEFVDWLAKEIPYYQLRSIVAPGITGWAQVRYKYGNTVEDAKEKLRYDLFYIKHLSLDLDLMVLFETIKTVLLGRGAR